MIETAYQTHIMRRVCTEAQDTGMSERFRCLHMNRGHSSVELEGNSLMAEPNDQRMGVDTVYIDLEVAARSMNMHISIDETYNLIVCKDCGIGSPFEWVPAHLRELHGIKGTLE